MSPAGLRRTTAPQAISAAAARPVPTRPVAPAAGPVAVRSSPWDALALSIAGGMMAYVWRIQDLYSILGAVKFATLVSIAALGLFAFDQDPRRALRGLGGPVMKLATAFFLITVLSGPFSLARGHSFWFIFQDFGKTFILFLLVAASIRSVADVEKYALALVVGGALYAFHVQRNVALGADGRVHDLIMYDSNDLGTILVCMLPLVIYFATGKRAGWARLLALVVVLLFVQVLIKTGSRGAFLGLIAVALYFLFGLSNLSKRTRVLIVTVGTIALTTLGGEQYWTLMRTLLHPTEDYNWSGNSEGGRMNIWKRGMGYMIDDPLTGVGAGAFPIAEGTISSLTELQARGIGVKWSAAHNSFVQVGAEIGVVGLGVMLALLFACYRTARQAGRSEPRRPDSDNANRLGEALAGSVVGFMVAGLFVSHGYYPYLFVLYGMIAGLTRASGLPAATLVTDTPSRGQRVRAMPIRPPTGPIAGFAPPHGLPH